MTQQATTLRLSSAAVVERTPPAARALERLDAVRFKLMAALQPTLDPYRVLNLFYAALQELVPCEGVQFVGAAGVPILHAGHAAPGRLSVPLSVDEETLGDLVLTGYCRLGAGEIHAAESLVQVLLYPLRNALLYQRALECARRDPLTGLGNRASLDEALERELRLVARHDAPLALLVVDLDDFKRINDEHGHLVGDKVLCELAALLQRSARQSDLLFRYGGDEFVILMCQSEVEGAARLAERVCQAVAGAELNCGREVLRLQVSVGFSVARPGDDAAALFERADRALLQAKGDGRNRVALR